LQCRLAAETACHTTADQRVARFGGTGIQPVRAFFRILVSNRDPDLCVPDKCSGGFVIRTLVSLFAVLAIVQTASPAKLAVSTYLKDGFSPAAIAGDAAGNVYLAGSAITDPASQTKGALVAKLDPKASRYLYLTYFDSAANDQVSAIAIDSAGNAYIAGWTTNPNFPDTGGGVLGTPPATNTDQRAFVAKLSPQGAVVFSVLIGGSSTASASGIALTPQGQILVSGTAGSGFPHTAGAYRVPDSNGRWFLMELDAGASKTIFSATGIGGSSIAVDAGGNIYLAGSSPGTDYPTTPGAYQTGFAQGHICYGLCQIGFNGNLQHVTKVDAAASRLIYSTGLNDPTGAAGSTTNTGLAIDTAGNAYVTGTLFEAQYPFTVTAPSYYSVYLTKLDPAGAKVLFSVPVGGAGVQLDSSGVVYVGGVVSNYFHFAGSAIPVAPPSTFSWIPRQCWPDNITAISEAYLMKVDPASGSVLDGQWIDGTAPGAAGIALASGRIWIAGETPSPDVPFSPGVLAPQNLGPGFLAGAYLSAADFSAGVSSGPQIACVLDGGNFTHVGPVAAFQLISIFGANLGPATGVAAPDGTDTSIAGVSITFDGNPAQLLYVSATQINVAVPAPLPSRAVVPLPSSTVMQLTVNGATVQRQFPFTRSNLNLFADLTSNEVPCAVANVIVSGFQPVAMNADGSRNSCANPAQYGSTVSFFMHGVGGGQLGFPPPERLLDIEAFVGACSAAVANAPLITGFVYKVDVAMPSSLLPCATQYAQTSAENQFSVTFGYHGEAVGPRAVPVPIGEPTINFATGQPMPMIVWLTK